MPKPNAVTLSIASGLLLSTALPGCARQRVETPSPVVVAVAVPAPTPPAELTACADRPAGLPEDPAVVAQIPTQVRAAVIRLARAFGANADRLDRLINWSTPGTCPAAAKAAD